MFLSKNHDQTILEISQGDYIAITAEEFIMVQSLRQIIPTGVYNSTMCGITFCTRVFPSILFAAIMYFDAITY